MFLTAPLRRVLALTALTVMILPPLTARAGFEWSPGVQAALPAAVPPAAMPPAGIDPAPLPPPAAAESRGLTVIDSHPVRSPVPDGMPARSGNANPAHMTPMPAASAQGLTPDDMVMPDPSPRAAGEDAAPRRTGAIKPRPGPRNWPAATCRPAIRWRGWTRRPPARPEARPMAATAPARLMAPARSRRRACVAARERLRPRHAARHDDAADRARRLYLEFRRRRRSRHPDHLERRAAMARNADRHARGA